MKKFTCVVATVFVAIGAAGSAFAGAEAGQSYFSAMGSYIDDDKARGLEDSINGGQISLGYAFNEDWNIEGMLSAAIPESRNHNLTPDENHLGLGVDLQRVFRRSERFSPYLHIGIGYFVNDPSGGASKMDGPMYSGGAGFLLDLFSSNVALRAEWRHRMETASSQNMNDNLFSLGLQIPFGPATPKFVDSDRDGVSDGMDRCPNTPAGASVDAYGCELDSDNDGVKDSRDKCPDTPAGATVDADGCVPVAVPMDGDKDGVLDENDECPDSAPGAQVDNKGCEFEEEIILEGVNFESNSDRLVPGASAVLDSVAAVLRKYPTIKIQIDGHTDSDGAADYNESLSARRATTVQDYLASNGVSDNRMSVRGYGESQPIAENTSAAGKAQNRRVVLQILER
jgi:OOP family OmpA-OmpF porin